GNRSEPLLAFAPQHRVNFADGHFDAQICEAGHAVTRLGNAAWHNSSIMGEIAVDVERDPVQRHPALDPDADGRDLVLVLGAFVLPLHPHADAIFAPLAADVE